MTKALQSGRWALLRIKEIGNAKNIEASASRTRLDIRFESVANPEESFWEGFYLSEKAISRLETMAHRAGVDLPCKKPSDVDLVFVGELARNRQVWAMLTEDKYGPEGAVKTDGWKFRSTDDPPEEENAIDYAARDEEAIALDGWN